VDLRDPLPSPPSRVATRGEPAGVAPGREVTSHPTGIARVRASRRSEPRSISPPGHLPAFGPENRPFAVRYWTGAYDPGDPSRGSRFTLVIRDPAALRRALLPPSELALGEAFVRGDLDVEGDLEAAGGLIDLLRANLSAPGRVASLAALLLRLPGARPQPGNRSAPQRTRRPWWPRHTRHRDAAAIRHHYDVGNDFYRLWLDPQTVYSCAYFPPGVRDVERAQQAKLDYICRKLRLKPGERLLDIGCGWGALIRHAVRHYGVEAVGITVSPAQAELAAGRIAEEGLEGRCRVELRDYRESPDAEAYDKVASVGMFEHVGRSHLAEYFARVYRALRPGGLFLNHGIIDLEDARPPSLGAPSPPAAAGGSSCTATSFLIANWCRSLEAVAAAEAAGFETRDVEEPAEHRLHLARVGPAAGGARAGGDRAGGPGDGPRLAAVPGRVGALLRVEAHQRRAAPARQARPAAGRAGHEASSLRRRPPRREIGGLLRMTTVQRRRSRVALVGFLAIAGFLLLTEHRAHLFGWLPFLFLLACPLLHVYGHGGHGGHRRTEVSEGADDPDADGVHAGHRGGSGRIP
jgi:cyclopropane-fatty-acyl-phospholipid synthase